MTILIQDCARNNLASWAVDATVDGYARGAILSPFCSPVAANGYKQAVHTVSERIQRKGGEVWFDPGTHALQMPQVGDYRYYNQWDLWDGVPGDLTTTAMKDTHVAKVFAVQTALGAPLLAPTVLLHSSQSKASMQAFEIAQAAKSAANGREFWLSVVGDSHFWSSGRDLDAHIGLLDQLEPNGWILSVARPISSVPVAAEADEVAGLMRTTFALQDSARVMIGHGDFAGLTAVAAGAESVGSGWDVRQRVLAFPDYVQRPSHEKAGGSWYVRPTLAILLGNLTLNEYSVLHNQQPALASRLYTGTHFAGPQNAFKQHAQVLSSVIGSFSGFDIRSRVEILRATYEAALAEWPRVQGITGSATAGDQWIAPLLVGLEKFKSDEGW